MNPFRRLCAIGLLICLVASCFPSLSRATDAISFRLTVEGVLSPGHTLSFGTEPELDGVIYGLRWDPGEPLIMLEGNTYEIPPDISDETTLYITAWWEDQLPQSGLELIIRSETPEPTTSPEETEPAETTPEETEPEASIPPETEPEETAPPETEPDTPPPGPGLYFGQLHGHTALSGGTGTMEEAFAYAAAVPGLDFFALTDHSHSFDGQQQWAAGKAAAEAVTGNDFVGIFGYEMSWQAQKKLGHIATFHTDGFLHRDQPPFDQQDTALSGYYAALAAQSGAVSQFNHPGEPYGNFSDFAYSETGDAAISLMEVGSGNGITTDAYLQALDKGWHLAPTNNHPHYEGRWGDAATGRTVVYAQALTEAALCEAMKLRRVYATEDSDLEILYSLNGFFMGSIVPRRQIGQEAEITASFFDPTDSAIGTVEILTTGGAVLTSQTVAENRAALTFSLSGEDPYYLLRVTQPDGDTALTAPVWIRQQEALGIRNLCCETAAPVQNQPITLALALFNQESAPLQIDSMEIIAGNQILAKDTTFAQLASGGELTHRITLSADLIGTKSLSAVVRGTLEGQPREYTAQISLSFRRSQEVQNILLAGNDDALSLFRKAAADNGLLLSDDITPETLETCRLLMVTAPEADVCAQWLDSVREFMNYGGSIAVFGCDDPGRNEGLNRLLEAIGATARLGAVLPGDTPPTDFTVNREDPFCTGVAPDQKYRMEQGCAVDPGQAQWLVKTGDPEAPATVLTREASAGGGHILVAGSLFPADSCIAEPENLWMPAYANRALALSLLDISADPLPITTIQQALRAQPGTLLKIRGYVTAGTDNPYTQFPDTLYLQDHTGGMAVIPFTGSGITIGTPLEVTGYPEASGNMTVLNPVSHRVPDLAHHIWLPQTGNWQELLSYERNGSLLVSVEGVCTQVQSGSDGILQCFTLKNAADDTVQVQIEPTVFSGATGKNTLHKKVLKGRTIRASGLLHIRPDGTTVIRVRNCDEVVYVPPLDEIPKTGDPIGMAVGAMVLCLALLQKRRPGNP